MSREQELFDACLALAAPERAAYLERACRGDLALRERIERLVAAHERARQHTLRPLHGMLGQTLRAARGARSLWRRLATPPRQEGAPRAAMLRGSALTLLGAMAALAGVAAAWQLREARAERERAHAIAQLASTILREAALEPWQAPTVSAERRARQIAAEVDRRLGGGHPLAIEARLHMLDVQARRAVDDARYDEALRVSREALELAAAGLGDRHRAMVAARSVHGRALAHAGDLRAGIGQLALALQDASAFFGPASREAGIAAGELAPWQREAGEIKRALQTSDRAIAILASHDGGESPAVAFQLVARGVTWLAARRGAEALRDLSAAALALDRGVPFQRAEALAHAGRLAEADTVLVANPVPSSQPRRAASAWHAVGVVRRLAGDPAAASKAQGEALASIGDDSLADRLRMRALGELGRAQVELGQHALAVKTLRRAVALFEHLELRRSPAQVEAQMALGRALIAGGQPAEGLPLLERADRFWLDFDPENRGAGEAALWLGLGYRSLGRGANAAQALARAERILARSRLPSDDRLVRGSRER